MSKSVDTRNLLTRAHDKKLCFVVKPRTEMMKKSLLYKGAVTWNNLPNDRQKVDTYKQFKERNKMHFRSILLLD